METLNPFLPFASPDIDDNEIQEVLNSLKGGWLTTGPKTFQFEREFQNFLGEDIHCLAVSSATAGLHLALMACNLKPGDKVALPVNTFASTAEVLYYLGCEPVFIDIEHETMNISISELELALKTHQNTIKAIIPVHIGGLPCAMDEIISLARQHDCYVIEDAAHAFPTQYKNQLIGTLESDFTVFSFYATKTITTAEGGMIATRHTHLLPRIKCLRLHGISRDVWDRYTSKSAGWQYDILEPGFKYNLSDLHSSLGLQQLKKALSFQKKRQTIAELYHENFSNTELTLPCSNEKNGLHAWHLYPIRLPEFCDRDRFIEKMTEMGVGTSVHFIPLHLMTYYKNRYGFAEEAFPQALRSFKKLVSIPIYTKMSEEQCQSVIKAVHYSLEQNSRT